jgi:RNA polymerase sigma-70 factor (ECF subfamily)
MHPSISGEDQELIQKAQRGDMAAFERLVYNHDKRVLAIAARYVTSAEDAKDIYQEVFMRVYRGLKRFKMESEFTTWLHRITVNVCLTHRSRARRHVHVSLDEPGDSEETDGHAATLAGNEAPTDQQSLDGEIAGHIEAALQELSPKQRLVFTMRHYEGYKLREIAKLMQCTEGTVKRYLFLATRTLRERLRQSYDALQE